MQLEHFGLSNIKGTDMNENVITFACNDVIRQIIKAFFMKFTHDKLNTAIF